MSEKEKFDIKIVFDDWKELFLSNVTDETSLFKEGIIQFVQDDMVLTFTLDKIRYIQTHPLESKAKRDEE